MAHYLAERQHHRKKGNFLQQFRDEQSKELKQLTASQFMEVWSHYDIDGKRDETENVFFVLGNQTKFLGNGYIEGRELDDLLRELASSAMNSDVTPEVKIPFDVENKMNISLLIRS